MSDYLPGLVLGFVICAAIICVAGWGMDGKRKSIADDCRRIGAFVSDDITYDCKPRSP